MTKPAIINATTPHHTTPHHTIQKQKSLDRDLPHGPPVNNTDQVMCYTSYYIYNT